MHNLLLALSAALTFAPAVEPDKFWLETPERKGSVEGTSPAVIDGVLLDQNDKQFHIRVVGGEIWLDKAKVVRVEKDNLTIDDIVKAEQQQREHLLAADRERQQAQAADASAHGSRGQPVEAVAKPEPAPEAQTPRVYDPVLHVLGPLQNLPNPELKRELELAYELTNDHTYIKLLRLLRRR